MHQIIYIHTSTKSGRRSRIFPKVNSVKIYKNCKGNCFETSIKNNIIQYNKPKKICLEVKIKCIYQTMYVILFINRNILYKIHDSNIMQETQTRAVTLNSKETKNWRDGENGFIKCKLWFSNKNDDVFMQPS